MSDKNSFVLYHDFNDVIEDLNDEEAGILFKSIYNYHLGKDYKTDDKMINVLLKQMIKTFERDKKKWLEIKEKRTNAVNKRWEKEKNKKKTSEKPMLENPSKEMPIKEEIKEKTFFSNKEINTLFLEYLKNRPQKKNTTRSINMLIKKCEDKTEEQIKEALINSISNGWLGLFFEKEKESSLYEEPNWEKEKIKTKETKEFDINKLLKEKGLK